MYTSLVLGDPDEESKKAQASAKTCVGAAGYLDWHQKHKDNMSSEAATSSLAKAQSVVKLRSIHVPNALKRLVDEAV